MQLGIEVTSRCNLQCSMCGWPSMTRPKKDMEFSLFCKIIDDIKSSKGKHGIQQLHFAGEPLLANRFDEMLEYLREHDMRVGNSFSTNCILLTPERTDRLLDAGFIEVHRRTKNVRLCIDSLDEEVYDKLRVGGKLDVAIENALYFISKTKGKLRGLKIQRIVTDINVGELVERYRKLFKIPVRSQFCGRHQDKSRDLRVRKHEEDIRPSCDQIFSKTMWVAQSGLVTACCLDMDMTMTYGDLSKQTIKEALKSKARKEQKRQFKAGEYDKLTVCSTCIGNECTLTRYEKDKKAMK